MEIRKSPTTFSSKNSSNYNSTKKNNPNQISYNFYEDNNISYKSDKAYIENNNIDNESKIYSENFSEGNIYNYPQLKQNNLDVMSFNTLNTYQEEKPLDLSKILKKENPEKKSKKKNIYYRNKR